jgi:hypothetical protein
LGEKLQEKFDTAIELIAGSGGVFEVSVNGFNIFSKKKKWAFPHCERDLRTYPPSITSLSKLNRKCPVIHDNYAAIQTLR